MGQKGLAVVAISSNSVTTHPQVQMTLYLQIEQCWSHWMIPPALTYSSQDGPDFMAEDAKIFKYPFPYLYDEASIWCWGIPYSSCCLVFPRWLFEDIALQNTIDWISYTWICSPKMLQEALEPFVHRSFSCLKRSVQWTLNHLIRTLNCLLIPESLAMYYEISFGLILQWLWSDSLFWWQDGRRPFELVYHGQFDDSRPSNKMRITGRLLLHF